MTIPANAEATITSIKSIDRQHLAALGQKGAPPADRTGPGASGQSSAAARGSASQPRSQKGMQVKTLTELRELRTTKNARLHELIELFKAADHETTDEEKDEYDGLLTEVKALDTDIRVAQFHAVQRRRREGRRRQ